MLTIWLKHTHAIRVQRLGNCLECLKPGLSSSALPDFKVDVDSISFLQWQQVEKKIVKFNQTMAFGQVIPK